LGWVFCLSATAYIEHQICTQKAWIISGDVVDVPFGGKRPPLITEPQCGTTKPKPPKMFRSISNPTQKIRLILRYHYFRNLTKMAAG